MYMLICQARSELSYSVAAGGRLSCGFKLHGHFDEALAPLGYPLRAYVTSGDGSVDRVPMRWGLWPADMARAWPMIAVEQASSSKLFGPAWRLSRCIVPTEEFYVSDGGARLKHGAWVSGTDHRIFPLAALYGQSPDSQQCCFGLLTRPTPTTLTQRIGPRMPVILSPEGRLPWLCSGAPDWAALLPQTCDDPDAMVLHDQPNGVIVRPW